MWCGVLVPMPPSHPRSKPGATPARVEICPPALHVSRPRWRQRLLDWLAGSWPEAEAPAEEAEDDPTFPRDLRPLEAARDDFSQALMDIDTGAAIDLGMRVRRARSLRELWHLRTEVFNVVSRHAGQGEATERLQRLNRHFPVRAPRSGFGGFDAAPHLDALR